ncbi:LssY C-terminal domain-containing protein, partial [Rhizobium ruizarguesonis]
PFSTFYLFGRWQDIGFQEPIDDSPRKRHHIRFLALSLAHSEDDMSASSFWLDTYRPSPEERVLWVGAGTRDTWLSLNWNVRQVR